MNTPTPSTDTLFNEIEPEFCDMSAWDYFCEMTALATELETKLAAVTEQRDRLADLVKQFVGILDITEESDSGRLFHPTNITSCRAGDLQKIGELVEALRRASRTTDPNEL